MRRIVAESLLLAVAPLSAAAQSGAPGPLVVTNPIYGAMPDAVWGVTDCSAAAQSNTVTCASESFSAMHDVGKTIILDDGAGAGIPLVTTIMAVSGAHTITIYGSTSVALPITHVPVLQVDPNNPGSGYQFSTSQMSSTQTIGCNGCGIPDTFGTPAVMTVVTAKLPVSGGVGSNLTFGSCVGTLAGQEAFPNQPATVSFSVTTMGTVQSGSVMILSGGEIYGDTTPSSGGTYTHPLSSASCFNASSTSPTFNIFYGIVLEQVTQVGAFEPSRLPTCSATATTTARSSPSGMGADFYCPGNYTSTASWGTDNTAAFERALADANAYAHFANPRPIYVPAGNYLLNPLNAAGAGGSAGMCSMGGTNCTPTCMPGGSCTNSCNMGTCQANIAVGYGAWLGDEHNHSNLFVVPSQTPSATAADLFSWLNAQGNGSQPLAGNTQTFSDPTNKNLAGSAVRNLTIIGDRASQTNQNAMSFYGRTAAAFVDNVVVSYMRGHAFGAGYPTTTPSAAANLIESRILNSNFDHDGDGFNSIPVLDIGSDNGAGSNNLDFTNLAITHPYGPGVFVHASNLSTTAPSGPRQIRFTNVRIEGTDQSLLGQSTAFPPDLLLLQSTRVSGTAGSMGDMADITCRNLQLVNPIQGAAALHIASSGPSLASASNIDCEGSIVSEPSNFFPSTVDYGRGVAIDTCTQCKITMAANMSPDVNLVVGTFTAGSPPVCADAGQPALSGAGLVYDGEGAESALSTCLDPLSTNLLSFASRQLLANSNLGNTAPAPPIDQLTSTVPGPSTTLSFTSTPPALPIVAISLTAPLWTVARVTGPAGPTAPFTDNWDTATNIISAINTAGGGSFAATGQVYRLRYCNQTSYAATLATMMGVGENLISTTIAAGSCANFALEVAGSGSITIISG